MISQLRVFLLNTFTEKYYVSYKMTLLLKNKIRIQFGWGYWWKFLFEMFWKYEDKIDIMNYFMGILRLLILLKLRVYLSILFYVIP